MAEDFPQPTYIHLAAATALLSESRTLRPSPTLLHAINLLIDELLWLSLDACADPGPTESEKIKLAAAGRREDERKGTIVWPLTTEKFKSGGVLKVLGNGVGKNAVLEAELASRELTKLGGDGGKTAATGRVRVEVVFAELRRWCDQLSPLGQRFKPTKSWSTSTSLLDTVLPLLLSPSHLASLPPSSLITPSLALWTSAVLTYLSEYVLRGIARVVERDPTHTVASPADLLVFAGEDEGGIWSAFEGMRVRAFVEREVLGGRGVEEGSRSRKNTLTKSTKRPSTAGSERKRSNEPASEGRPSTASGHSHSHSVSSPAPISSTVSTISTGSAPTKNKGGGGAAAGLRRIGSLSKATGVGREGRMRSASNRSGKSVASDERELLGAEAGDAFEELMLSGKTMKVSLTPGRLKTMEDKEKGSTTLKLLPEFSPDAVSQPPADPTAEGYPFPSTPPPPRRRTNGPRLVARSPLTTRTDDLSNLSEESEELDADEGLDSEDERMGYKRKPKRKEGGKEKKESLADILNSPPPWAEAEPEDPPFSNLAPASALPVSKPADPLRSSPGTSTITFSPTASTTGQRFSPTGSLGGGAGKVLGPTTSTTSGRGAAMLLGRPLEPQTETKRNDTRELAAFFAQGPPPGIGGGASELSLPESPSPEKSRKKGLKGMMSRLRSKDGAEDEVNGRGAGLYKQRSSPTLRGQQLDPTPPPAVPSLPPQHRPGILKRPSSGGRHSPLKSAIPFGGTAGERDTSPKGSLLEQPASTPTLTGAATPTPASPTPLAKRPVSGGSTSPRRKPVSILDEATLHIVAASTADAPPPARSPRMRELSHCSTDMDETASLETAPSRVDRLSRTASVEPVASPTAVAQAHNVLLGLHTPPPSDTGLAAMAAGAGAATGAAAVAVAKEGAAPITPPASPPREDGAQAAVEAGKGEKPTQTPNEVETGDSKLDGLRRKMAACTTVAECLALMDAAISYSSKVASETGTQTDDQHDGERKDEEAAVIAWLLGELPAPEWVPTDASDASSIAASGVSTGLTSPNPCKDDKDSVDHSVAFETPSTLVAEDPMDGRHGQALVAASA